MVWPGGSRFVAVALTLLCRTSVCDRISSALYTDLNNAKPCTRLLTKDGEIGCASDGTVVGALRLFDGSRRAVLESPPKERVAVAIAGSFFNESTIDDLEAALDIAGLLVLYEDAEGAAFSPSSQTPQEYITRTRGGGLYPWNPEGSAMDPPLALRKFSYPVIALDADESAVVRSRAEDNENQGADAFMAHVAEFKYEMFASGNSISCLEDALCLPVGGWSVWTTLNRLNATTTNTRPLVIATAMMDSSAFFHDLAIGAESYQSGLVALLATARALGRVNSSAAPSCTATDALPKEIAFTAFQGEQFGFVGSRRFVEDISTPFTCERTSGKFSHLCLQPYAPDGDLFPNLNVSRVEAVIELSQLGAFDETNPTAFVHGARLGASQGGDHSASTRALMSLAAEIAALSPSAGALSVANASQVLPGLPPSSVPSFLESGVVPDDVAAAMGAIVLADHNTTFRTSAYLSRFDVNLTTPYARQRLCAAARLGARLVYAAAGGTQSAGCLGEIDALVDCDHVSALLDCMVSNWDCSIVRDLLGSVSDGPVSHYTGVFLLRDPDTIEGVPKFLNAYLAQELTRRNGFGAAYHNAIDPVLAFDYSNGLWKVRSDKSYSNNRTEIPSLVFTESNWSSKIGSRLYRRHDPVTQAVMLALGLVTTVGALLLGYFLRPYVLRNYKT